jgi:hypothetical protein
LAISCSTRVRTDAICSGSDTSDGADDEYPLPFPQVSLA